MSIPSLTERLDDLSAADKESAQVVPLETQMQELIPLTDAGQEFEPTQVAGPGGIFRKIIKEAPVRTERPILPEGVAQGKVGQSQVIRETGAKGEVIIESMPQMPTTGKPSPTPTEKAAGVPETAFNLDMIQDADGVKQFIEATARAYGADKIEKISYKQMAEELSVSGYDEGFIARIIDPLQATKASPQDAYKMQLALVDAGKRAFDLGEQVKVAEGKGQLTPDLTSEFMQAVALEGALVKAVKGRQADIARTLGIFSQARQSSTQRGEMLKAIMNETGGISSVHDFAKKYTALSASGRANMAESGYGNTVRGVFNRVTDMTMSTFINGLLSSPVTHAKNIAGNTFFGGLQIPERALASAIGKTRNFMFKGGEEAISTDEIYAQAMGFLQGIREGGEIAGRAFKNNTPTDPFQKIEATRLNREPFEMDFGDSDTGKAVSGAISYYGKFVTLPGRALMAEDEFFKAVGYRMELNALAVRESEKMYKSLVESGVTPDNAARQSADFMANLLVNPTPDIQDAAMGVSRTVTFTRELEPTLQGIQRFAQNPLIKMFVPFIKTPTNIALEAIARTPAFAASPRFWSDFNAGGIRRDQALARATLGSALIYSVSAGVFEGRVTGYGPMRMEDKKALEGTGWQQFSFVFDTKDVSEEMMAKFEKLTTVSRGPDKVYISYAGLEPVGTLLAIGATSGEYAQMKPGGEDLDKLMTGGTLALYTYLSEQPMLKGISDIQKVFTSGSTDGPTILYDFINAASKQVSQFAIGGSPVGVVHNSFVASVERIVDPTKSNTMPTEMSTKEGMIEPAVRGFYEAVRYYKSRNPLTSDSLPRALDPITGEVEMVGKGKLYEMFNPFKESSGKYNQAKAVLVAYGVPMYIPKKSVDGIQLSATQYNRWIELATQDGALAEQIAFLGESDAIQNLASRDLGAAQAIITKTITDAYSVAKERLKAEDPDLFDALREVDEFKKDFGKYKR
jgi:hypothetical protein